LLSQLKPPFRAEHIGSLLRPTTLLEHRSKFARGEIGADALTAAEDVAIKDAIALQQRVGLKFATDGEFRRRSYHSFFYRQLGDLSIDTVGGEDAKGGIPGKRASQPTALIKSRVKWTHPINVPDFKFIAANTGLTPKITIPGPCALHFRGGDAAVLASAYKDIEQFWDDTVEAFGHELQALADAGCRYVQIDETAFACAASWSSTSVVAVYSGGIHFYKPIRIGDLVEVDARLIHTSPHSMHISVRVRTGPPASPRELVLSTQCLTVFVDRGPDQRASAVKPLITISDEDRRLDAHAVELMALRDEMAVIPPGLARFA